MRHFSVTIFAECAIIKCISKRGCPSGLISGVTVEWIDRVSVTYKRRNNNGTGTGKFFMKRALLGVLCVCVCGSVNNCTERKNNEFSFSNQKKIFHDETKSNNKNELFKMWEGRRGLEKKVWSSSLKTQLICHFAHQSQATNYSHCFYFIFNSIRNKQNKSDNKKPEEIRKGGKKTRINNWKWINTKHNTLSWWGCSRGLFFYFIFFFHGTTMWMEH